MTPEEFKTIGEIIYDNKYALETPNDTIMMLRLYSTINDLCEYFSTMEGFNKDAFLSACHNDYDKPEISKTWNI